ncbi:MAG: hypothetical protein A2W18_05615 [Candidatus Muproteobacteria bacterium RBG_16_60_9]|uniref:Toxin-antitoxin antitoxin component n=1 Tax=Candidatus Muproteobacteria bacterium RBG_16_60_9 TaxID=1817755 RepID=A0A1F6V5U2_9PROT|nr:MAG: hypothetical protein A2W18_05615 [Candidatus Muproteobacteria bacterium RBG_16_60_9]
MADDVILNKSAIIERCLRRIEDEYRGREHEIETNYTRQDAVVLNLLRACEAAIDLAMHVVRVRRLGLPQESREAFTLLEQAGLVDPAIASRMRAMVGFRNIAVHDYRKLSLPIMRAILDKHLEDFRRFAESTLRAEPK